MWSPQRFQSTQQSISRSLETQLRENLLEYATDAVTKLDSIRLSKNLGVPIDVIEWLFREGNIYVPFFAYLLQQVAQRDVPLEAMLLNSHDEDLFSSHC